MGIRDYEADMANLERGYDIYYDAHASVPVEPGSAPWSNGMLVWRSNASLNAAWDAAPIVKAQASSEDEVKASSEGRIGSWGKARMPTPRPGRAVRYGRADDIYDILKVDELSEQMGSLMREKEQASGQTASS